MLNDWEKKVEEKGNKKNINKSRLIARLCKRAENFITPHRKYQIWFNFMIETSLIGRESRGLHYKVNLNAINLLRMHLKCNWKGIVCWNGPNWIALGRNWDKWPCAYTNLTHTILKWKNEIQLKGKMKARKQLSTVAN